jgi:hypothetical protein
VNLRRATRIARSSTLIAAALAVSACAGAGGAAGGDHPAGVDPDVAPAADTIGIAFRDGELSPAFLVTPDPATLLLRIDTIPAGRDPRDVLDPGDPAEAPVDVLITRDPATIAYARARGGFRIDTLPWDRVYAAVVSDPSRYRLGATEEFRASLARDAVRAEARAARPPYAWEMADCSSGRPASDGRARRVAYASDDPVALGIAERLVALDATIAVAGLRSDSLERSVRDGAHAVYVVALPAVPPGVDSLGVEPCAGVPPYPAGAAVMPLIETRAHAISRPGTPRLLIEPGRPVRVAPGDSAGPR